MAAEEGAEAKDAPAVDAANGGEGVPDTDPVKTDEVASDHKSQPETVTAGEGTSNGDVDSASKKKKRSGGSVSHEAGDSEGEAAGSKPANGVSSTDAAKEHADSASEEPGAPSRELSSADGVAVSRKKSALSLEESNAEEPKEDPAEDDPLADPSNYRRYYQAIFTAFKTGASYILCALGIEYSGTDSGSLSRN